MTNQLRSNIGALFTATAMVLGYTSNANAYVIETCQGGAVCTPAGALTQGWDGPGLGSFTLGYYIGNPTRADLGLGGFSVATIESAFLAAAATWSSVVQVTFSRLGDATGGANGAFAPNSVDFYFHGGADATDGFPFDGAWNPNAGTGSVFAHAWGPQDIQNGIVAGNIHFDGNETWVTSGAVIGANSATIDLQSVLLHELGHVLGLGHTAGSSLSDPVMQSLYWGEQRSLRADDIAGIRTLYACAGQGCPTDPGNGDGNGNVPEPSTLLLLGLGLVAWRGVSRRQTRP